MESSLDGREEVTRHLVAYDALDSHVDRNWGLFPLQRSARWHVVFLLFWVAIKGQVEVSSGIDTALSCRSMVGLGMMLGMNETRDIYNTFENETNAIRARQLVK